ncbi:hypothetical protein FJT64_002436 [Amphibalanus amphitrite]|uniref:Pacifastin domain-containing protein n=1 Tax=Amphibalanus amphitrite TaxID=1232801 RepID=A0A6A4WF18_AMPAM|nr:hypothetical protein FJT64_024274 [Amphibalanus amphitrite]KAF0306411.1 hypothetical protein FJT64_002436 [Amphibalanus amphitrite]
MKQPSLSSACAGVEPFRCEPGAVWMEACSHCRCEMDSHVVCTHRVCLEDEIEAAVEAVEAAVQAEAEAEAAAAADVQRQFGFGAISRRRGIPRRR